MEFKAISNLDKLTNEGGNYNIWLLRLKNALKLVDDNYVEVIELVENIEKPSVSYETWQREQVPKLFRESLCDQAQFNKLSTGLYTVLVDKCTDNQVITFENEGSDGFFAFNQVNHLMTRTAGLGGLERREYIYNPTVATKDSEVYGLIMAWEREMRG